MVRNAIRPIAIIPLFLFSIANAQERHVSYTCAGGQGFQVRYMPSQRGQSYAVVFAPGRAPITLPRVRSASGTRYSEGGTTLLSKSDTAVLTMDSKTLRDCKSTDSRARVTGPLMGMFWVEADSAYFKDCDTGWQLPVADTPGYQDMMRSYREQKKESAKGVYVTVDGRVEIRPPQGDPAATRKAVPTLVVNKFVSGDPGGSCGESQRTRSDTPLPGRWNLSALAGDRPELPKPIFIEFREKDGRVAGFSGCNRFTGAWSVEGAKLTLGKMATTRMACMGAGGEWENKFLKMLDGVVGFEVMGATLELKDASDQTLAKFQKL